MSRTVIKPEPGFRAELPGLDLATLIQMTCARRERLVVRVSSYGEEGFLFSSDGRLVHATVGDLVGEEAVLRMLHWPTGEFALCDRPFPLRPTIEASTEALLLRAAQRLDEAALDRATDLVLAEEVGLADQLEPEPPAPPQRLLPAGAPPADASAPRRPPPPPPPRIATWPVEARARESVAPTLASLLQARADDSSPAAPARAADRPAIPPRPSAPPSRSSAPDALPPVSLGRISEPPRRRSEPPPVHLPRPVATTTRLPSEDVLASVRLDARGEVVGTFGGDDQLAQLVAYVSRIASLLQADFALDPFDALHAELAGKRVLIYREAGELIGAVMKPGSAAQQLRQRLGV